MRLRDMERVEDYSRQYENKKARVGDPTYNFSLALAIVTIGDKQNMDELDRIRWVKNQLGGDLRAIRNDSERRETGFDLRPQCKCSSCGVSFRPRIPIDFFRAFSAES